MISGPTFLRLHSHSYLLLRTPQVPIPLLQVSCVRNKEEWLAFGCDPWLLSVLTWSNLASPYHHSCTLRFCSRCHCPRRQSESVGCSRRRMWSGGWRGHSAGSHAALHCYINHKICLWSNTFGSLWKRLGLELWVCLSESFGPQTCWSKPDVSPNNQTLLLWW